MSDTHPHEQGSHGRFVRLMFTIYTVFRSRLSGVDIAQTVTRNRYAGWL